MSGSIEQNKQTKFIDILRKSTWNKWETLQSLHLTSNRLIEEIIFSLER